MELIGTAWNCSYCIAFTTRDRFQNSKGFVQCPCEGVKGTNRLVYKIID